MVELEQRAAALERRSRSRRLAVDDAQRRALGAADAENARRTVAAQSDGIALGLSPWRTERSAEPGGTTSGPGRSDR